MSLLKEFYFPIVNMFGYGQVESKYGSGQFLKDLEKEFPSEDALVMFTESNTRPSNADAIWEMLLYLGAADSPGFPLTWEAIKEMLDRLGRPVQNVTA